MSGIIRAPRADNFSLFPNSTIRDSRLTYRARGILCRLLSNADGYRMTGDDLARDGVEGRGAILSALKELREAGYIVVTKRQGVDGRWSTDTFVFDTPQTQATGVQLPDSGKPDVGAPDVGSPDAIKKTSKKEKKKTTTTPNPSSSKAAEMGSGGGLEGIREMLIAQANAAGKANPTAWAAGAVRRIKKTGIDADTQAQFDDWKASQARAAATKRAVQAARQSRPCEAPAMSATPIGSSYPGREALLQAIIPMPPGGG